MKIFRIQTFKSKIRRQNPKILVSNDIDLAIFWSAKSASTFVLKWFFYQLGLLDEVLKYHHFPHKYRQKIFMHSSEYQQAVNAFIKSRGRGYYKVKVVRDPYERAVSSYIHLLVGLKRNHEIFYMDFPSLKGRTGLSFEYFVTLLEQLDIQKCNPHWRAQFSPSIKNSFYDQIVLAKALQLEIPKIEKKLGLKSSIAVFDELQKSIHHSKVDKSNNTDKYVGNIKFDANVRQSRPAYSQFYSPELKLRVKIIYQNDFDAFRISEQL